MTGATQNPVRNRADTERRILDAAEGLVLSGSARAITINAIADRAGVDKVLIYRYFGRLPGLLQALVERRRVLSPDPGSPHAPARSLAEGIRSVLLESTGELRASSLLRALLALADGDPGSELTAFAARLRAVRAERLADRVTDMLERFRHPPYIDCRALTLLLEAGATSLALHPAKTPDGENAPLDPLTDAGHRRLHRLLAAITNSLLSEPDL
jgi:AcrR family transcriptional regulator